MVNVAVPGNVDRHAGAKVENIELTVPPGRDARDYALATFRSSSGPIGHSNVTLLGSDEPDAASGAISFRILPEADRTVAVRVGSCLQWKGLSGSRIHLLQRGGRPIDSVTLSDVGR